MVAAACQYLYLLSLLAVLVQKYKYVKILTPEELCARYMPDDNLLRQDKLPLVVNMPRTNKLEHVDGIYKTGLVEVSPRNFAWRYLPSVDRHVSMLMYADVC